MTTINAGEKNVVLLNEGQVLTVTGDAHASGVVYKCVDSSATNSSHSYAVSASSSQVIGPFAGISIMLLTCAVGSISAAASEASLGGGGGAVSSVNTKVGAVALTAADVGAAPAPYAIGAVHFDGANSSLVNAALACSDNGHFSMSYWIKFAPLALNGTILVGDRNGSYNNAIVKNTIAVGDAAGNNFFGLDVSGEVTPAAYHHVLMSFDTNHATGQKLCKVIVDGLGATHITSDDAAFISAWNGLSLHFGDDAHGNGFIADFAEVWIAPGVLLLENGDIPDATLRKFITSDGKPVNLGANGELPTGTAPAVFFHADVGNEVATFPTNRGTGGTFSLVGNITTASASPSNNPTFDSVGVFTKNQSVTPYPLISGASIPVDASLSNNFRLVLATNATLANPINLTDGMILNFRVKQDGTGSRTLAYGSKYKFPGGTPPVLSTAAGAVDFFSGYYDATDDVIECNFSKGYA